MAKTTIMNDKIRSLHKRLIPANVIACILALAAMLCTILMPWIDIRFSVDGTEVASYVETLTSDSSTEEESGTSEPDIIMEGLFAALEDLDIALSVNVYPTKMMSAATGGEKEMATFFNSLIGKVGALIYLRDLIAQVSPVVVETFAELTIDDVIEKAFEAAGKEMGPSQTEQLESYKAEAMEAVSVLMGSDGNPGNPTLSKEKFATLAARISAEQQATVGITIPPDDLTSVYNDLVDKGINEQGQFNVVVAIEGIIENITEEDMQNNQTAQALEKVVDFINNPGQALASALGENITTARSALMAASILLFIFPAAMWALLAIFAIIRIFTEKKLIKTWYVCLFCLWSGLLLLVLNIAWSSVRNLFVGNAAILSALHLSFLGSGIVTGSCWVAVVLLSWFYYGIIKRKIRKEEKRIRSEAQPLPTYDA